MLQIKEKKWVIFPLVLLLFGVLCFVYKGDIRTVFNETQESPFYEGVEGENEVAFAMNVDWGEEYIPEVLEILKKEDVKITFFLTGRWCDENPLVAKSIYQEKMEIGNHGLRHKSPNAMTYEENTADLTEAEKILNKTLGIKTTLFAPASGEREEQVLTAASDLGYQTILWSVDTIDWQKPTPEVMLERVASKVKDGSIVLMHPTENTVKALPMMIKDIKEKGYSIVTVSKVINLTENL